MRKFNKEKARINKSSTIMHQLLKIKLIIKGIMGKHIRNISKSITKPYFVFYKFVSYN